MGSQKEMSFLRIGCRARKLSNGKEIHLIIIKEITETLLKVLPLMDFCGRKDRKTSEERISLQFTQAKGMSTQISW